MKYTKHLWAKLLALGLIGAFSAQMVLAASPKTLTYSGPGGPDRGYIEQIIKSENEIQFQLCENGPNSCSLMTTDAGKNTFTAKELSDLASKQYLQATFKTGQDVALTAVTFLTLRKLVLRPVAGVLSGTYLIAKGGGRIAKTAILSSPVIILVGEVVGFTYYPDDIKKVNLWAMEQGQDVIASTIELGSHLMSGKTSRLQRAAERQANELLDAGQRKATELGVPSLDEMSGMVTDARQRADSIVESSTPFFQSHLNPVRNIELGMKLNSAAEAAINEKISDVTVPNLAEFARALLDGLEGNYSLR